MGTRADFYIGRGKDAEWLGSIGYNGHPDRDPEKVLDAKTEKEFRDGVERLIESKGYGTFPEDGWPWPWEDSRTTDFAYAFDSDTGTVVLSRFGGTWETPKQYEARRDRGDDIAKTATFPDMTARQNVTLGPRSGVMILGKP